MGYEAKALSWREAAAIWLAAAAAIAGAAAAGLVDSFEPRWSLVAAFGARESLGRTPPLDPRVKIFAWDDATVAQVKSLGATAGNDIPLASWGRLLTSLAERRPSAIFIDRLFDSVIGADAAPAFVAAVKALSAPVIVGVRSSPQANVFRAENTPPAYVDAVSERVRRVARNPDPYLYGPDLSIEAAFRGVGHILWTGETTQKPFVRVGKRAVPHWSLVAASLAAHGDFAHIVGPDGADDAAERPIDFQPRAELLKSTRSMAWLIERVRSQVPLEWVRPGDVVMLLPAFYTGGTDFKWTPFGKSEGGLVEASLLNTALRGDALVRPAAELPMVLALAAAGIATVTLAPPAAVALPLALAAALIAGGGLLAFAFGGVQLPWGSGLLAYLGLAAVGGALRSSRHFVLGRILQRDAELGATAQSFCLPDRASGTIGPWSYEVVFAPYSPMSGDWYQAWEGGGADGFLGAVAVGDVVGKGPSAALATAVVATVWRGYFARVAAGKAPAAIAALVAELEGALQAGFRAQQATACALAFFYADRVELARFGSNPWVAAGPALPAAQVRARSPGPIGTMKVEVKAKTIAALPAGADTLVAFSDGVLEGSQPMRRFLEDLTADRGGSARALFDKACKRGEGVALPDDRTMVVVRRQPPA